MKLCSKVGVVTLLLVFAAVQVMACAVPSGVATPAERACCKQMANRCGEAGMVKSYPCCRISPTDVRALPATSPQSTHTTLLVLQELLPASAYLCLTPQTLGLFYAPSPPGIQSLYTIVLRI